MTMHYYKVTLRVRNDVGVLTRITTRLRKFQVNIQSLEVHPIDELEKYSDIHMVLETTRPDITIIMRKVEAIIPVIKAFWQSKEIGEDLHTV